MMAPQDDKALVEFLEDAAKYFEKRPTGGEDKAFWANVTNARNCRAAAARIQSQAADKARIAALEAENARLREALEPFAEAAEENEDIGREDPEENRIQIVQVFGCSLATMTDDDLRRAKTALETPNG